MKEKQNLDLYRDSPFYRVEQRLNELGFVRNPWEPPLAWIQRMRAISSLEIFSGALQSLLYLYYQERFSERELTGAQQAQLEEEVDVVLERLQRASKEELRRNG